MKTKYFLTIILGVTVISGCYTVLQHPEVPNQDEMGNVYHQNINTTDNCYNCHSQKTDQINDYDKYMNYYTNSGSENEYNIQNRWDSYYSVPWWFRPPTVTVGTGSGSSLDASGNHTTSNQGNTTVRPSGSVRSNVNISAPAPTRGAERSGETSTSADKKQDTQTATRSNNNNANNTGNTSGKENNSNSSNDTKRNSGSTRGK